VQHQVFTKALNLKLPKINVLFRDDSLMTVITMNINMVLSKWLGSKFLFNYKRVRERFIKKCLIKIFNVREIIQELTGIFEL